MGEQHLFTNRLIQEKSPYLLQHAHNPVDWYAWGEEAFKAAQDHDKPIFLSIGYATCHWCHTMEHESFENIEIAHLMNEAFINIKVDREELPEVDALYMDFAQSMMAGSAGWPLNIILTPRLEPFFASTYLPPTGAHGMMGLVDFIKRIEGVWHGSERDKIEVQASRIVEFFADNVRTEGDVLPSKSQVADAVELIYKIADPVYGGLKGSPKFPVGYQNNFLLSYSQAAQDNRALFLVERSLDMMHRGGIYDHIGGGFSRYSVDDRWLIPHFEKMLYDNALMAGAYIDAWRFTKKKMYRKVAAEILDYVIRVMTHPEGGFYSAEDADSEGHEGRFYTWNYEEIEKVLGKEKGAVFSSFYGASEEGNFEGANVLHTPLPVEEFASKHELSPWKLEKELVEGKERLFQVRETREHPFKDDKILTSWNGWMIHAFAEAGSAFSDERFTKAAKQAVDFLKIYLWDRKDLFHRWRDGEASHRGSLDDYVCLIRGLLTLFEKGEGLEYLEWALQLTNLVEKNFKSENGAFFQTDGKDPSMIIRRCQFADGAEPSGNSIHCENLLRLYDLTKENSYLEQAKDILKAVKIYLDQFSPGYFYHVMNLHRLHGASGRTYVVALNEKREHFEALKRALGESYRPFAATILLEPSWNLEKPHLSFLKSYPPERGKTTLYICSRTACLPPITDIDKMLEAINK
jgi:uncharacterized protein